MPIFIWLSREMASTVLGEAAAESAVSARGQVWRAVRLIAIVAAAGARQRHCQHEDEPELARVCLLWSVAICATATQAMASRLAGHEAAAGDGGAPLSSRPITLKRK